MNEIIVQVRENGPYLITGEIKVVDQQGREFERPPGTGVTFCRCGHSAYKPFCDGSHKSAGFESDHPAPRNA
jgi:CDGSH iron-sulfur domain-containing protein 3